MAVYGFDSMVCWMVSWFQAFVLFYHLSFLSISSPPTTPALLFFLTMTFLDVQFSSSLVSTFTVNTVFYSALFCAFGELNSRVRCNKLEPDWFLGREKPLAFFVLV